MNLMNCEQLMRNYLLSQNGLYRIKWPLAILISVIAINVLLNSNTKMEQWYIYVIALVVSFIVILLCNIFASASITGSELASLVRKCTNCNLDNVKEHLNTPTVNNHLEQFVPSQESEEEGGVNVDYTVGNRITTEETPVELNNDAALNNEEEGNTVENFTDDRMFHGTNSPIGDSYPSKQMSFAPLTPDQQAKQDSSKCLLGKDGCMPLCSGYTNNPCNIVSPVPGPTWQVQTAATVQNRLVNNQFVPSKCPIGPQVLRRAPDCSNIPASGDRSPQQVQCYSAQEPTPYNVQ